MSDCSLTGNAKLPEKPSRIPIERTNLREPKALSRLDIVENESYKTIDRTGEGWIFIVVDGNGVLSPLSFAKPRTKLELIRWFNNRKNRPAEVEYSEKSVSSKRRDRIIAEIADGLLDAEKQIASRLDCT